MTSRWTGRGASSAGLFAGAAAWAVSTQLNYALVGWVCERGTIWLTPALSAVLMAVSLGGGFVSWKAWEAAGLAPARDGVAGTPLRFLAGIGIMSAVLFALVIATQGAAAFVLHGCER
jgi:hypothetical protein